MADDTPAAPAPITPYDPEAIQRALATLGLNPPTQAPASTADGPGAHGFAGFIGDVGNVLGGGGSGLLGLGPDEQAAAGRRALMAAGVNMLIGGGPSYYPKNFGTVLGHGLEAAMQSRDQSERDVFAAHGSQQQLAQQAYQNRLNAIKTALPLLLRQQMAGQPNPLADGATGAPGTSITAAANLPAYGGAVNAPPMPAEYEQHFQDAAKTYGVPVALLKAVTTQESGFNPDAKNGGLMQITAGTAKNPGYGMQGVDNPEQLRDPRSNIMFGAQYLAGIAKKLGVDLNTPEGQAAALKAYNGGGDKEYVAHVFRYMPPGGAGGGTQVAAAKPPAAAPAAPPAPGRVQVATATPTTQTDATPAPVAGTEAPVAPALPFPGYMSPEDWRAQHPTTIDPSLYSVPGPDAAVVADAQREKTTAAQILANVRSQGGDESKPLERYTAATQNLAKLQQDAAAKSVELRQKAEQEAGNQNQQLYNAEMERRRQVAKDAAALQQTAAEKEKDRQAQIALEAQKGDEARKTASAASENSFTLDTRKKLADERQGAQENLDNLGIMDQLSASAGPTSGLDTVPGLRKWLSDHKIGTDEQLAHWGTLQAYEAATKATVLGLRKGISMGQLSDRDMEIIQGLGPNDLQAPETRAAITAYIRQLQLRKVRFVDKVEELWDGGNGRDANGRPITYGNALIQARRSLGDPLKQITQEQLDNPELRKKWAKDNGVVPGSLFRMPNGDLQVSGQPKAVGQ